MDKVIVMTAYKRPDYLNQTLDALSRCVGIKEYKIIVSVDPASDVNARNIIREMITKICFCECVYIFNQTRLGTNRNIHGVLDAGFKSSDYVVHLDDDVLFGPDALCYFEYHGRKYRNDVSVFSIAGTNNRKCESTEDYIITDRRQWYTPWGWGTWKDRWEEAGGTNYCWGTDKRSWDTYLNRKTRRDRYEVYPLLARTKNVGEIGENTPSVDFFNKYCLISSWSGDRRWASEARERALEWSKKE